jgi:L-amino acid N-acyltransferase YncA
VGLSWPVPDDFLDGLGATVERRAAGRRKMLAQPGVTRTWVVEQGSRLVGFADTGPCRAEAARPTMAELDATSLDQAVVGRGIGRALLAHARDDPRRRGYQAAIPWVLVTNARARRFDEAAGWRADGAARTEYHPAWGRPARTALRH